MVPAVRMVGTPAAVELTDWPPSVAMLVFVRTSTAHTASCTGPARPIVESGTMLYDTAQGNSKGVRFETTIGINAPVGTVWALIDRLEEWPRWMPSIKNIERLSKEPLAVGSQLSVTARVSGLTVTLLMTIAEFDWERSVVMQGKVLGTKLTRFYALEPVGDMTRVTIGGDVSGTLAWLARRGGKKISDEIALAVKKRIEGWE